MEALRSDLLTTQIDRLGREIKRLLAPDGRCYLSFEMFHKDEGEDDWYFVQPMAAALQQLAKRFRFDFQTTPESAVVSRYQGVEGESVIHQYLLRHAS